MQLNIYNDYSRFYAKTELYNSNQTEKKNVTVQSKADSSETKDNVFISEESRNAARQNSAFPSEMETIIRNKDIDALIESAKEKCGNLEVNWDAVVDRDGKIFGVAYVEGLLKQYVEAESNIKEYYSEAHKENLTFKDPYIHIMQKYKISDSLYFRSDMSQEERDMSFYQERALLWGSNVALGDPYALASSGGVMNIKNMDKIALQYAKDKINELIKEKKESLGISE